MLTVLTVDELIALSAVAAASDDPCAASAAIAVRDRALRAAHAVASAVLLRKEGIEALREYRAAWPRSRHDFNALCRCAEPSSPYVAMNDGEGTVCFVQIPRAR